MKSSFVSAWAVSKILVFLDGAMGRPKIETTRSVGRQPIAKPGSGNAQRWVAAQGPQTVLQKNGFASRTATLGQTISTRHWTECPANFTMHRPCSIRTRELDDQVFGFLFLGGCLVVVDGDIWRYSFIPHTILKTEAIIYILTLRRNAYLGVKISQLDAARNMFSLEPRNQQILTSPCPRSIKTKSNPPNEKEILQKTNDERTADIIAISIA